MKKQDEKLKIYLLALFLLGALVRVFGVFTAPWLDEIWTINLANSITPFQNPLSILHDNNHIIITFWISIFNSSSLEFLRIFPFFSSILALGLFIYFPAKNKTEQLMRSVLFTFSYPLIIHAAELRGYSTMIFAIVLTLIGTTKFIKSHSNLDLIIIIIGAILGLLSHGSFILWISAISIYVFINTRSIVMPSTTMIVVFLSWILFYGNLPPGQGTILSTLDVIVDWLSIVGGGTSSNPYIENSVIYSLLFACLTGIIIIRGIILSFKNTDDMRWLFLFTLVFCPLIIIVLSPKIIYPRYFLFTLPLIFILLSKTMSYLWFNETRTRPFIASFFLLFFFSSILNIFAFIELGRGKPMELLENINKDEGRISSDLPFRVYSTLNFFKTNNNSNIFISSILDAKNPNTKWFIKQSEWAVPNKKLIEMTPSGYDLVMTSESAPNAGISFYLFRKKI